MGQGIPTFIYKNDLGIKMVIAVTLRASWERTEEYRSSAKGQSLPPLPGRSHGHDLERALWSFTKGILGLREWSCAGDLQVGLGSCHQGCQLPRKQTGGHPKTHPCSAQGNFGTEVTHGIALPLDVAASR